MDNESQKRHEALVKLLSSYSQYQGSEKLRIKKKSIPHHLVSDIPDHEIVYGVIAFCDFLNIHSGSAGDVNLYELLKSYLKNGEKKKKINEIISR